MKKKISGYINRTILITGANGYVGDEFCSLLKSFDHKIIVSKCDLDHKENWRKIINEDIDFIFHLAAVETKGADLSMNSRSVLFMLETCVEKKCYPKIIFTSSTNLFGDTVDMKVNEKTPSNPISEFSAHKFLAESYLKHYYKNYNILSIILRIPNLYGPVKKGNNFERVVLNRVIKTAVKTKELILFNNMKCKRDYVYIHDLIEAIYVAGLVEENYCDGSFYVIGSNISYTIESVWKAIQTKINSSKIFFDLNTALEPMEYRDFNCDSSNFRKISGWESKISLEKGLNLTLEQIA